MRKSVERNSRNSTSKKNSCEVSNWKEQLSYLDINNIHPSRTCETFFMLELQESYTTAIQKFCRGSKIDPSSVTKCITYEDILTNIEHFGNAAIQDNKINELIYKEAAREATCYLSKNQTIPCDLMAKLIKLEVIDRIKKDVSQIQYAIYVERLFENERKQLSVNPNKIDPKGKKDKGKKESKGKKGKPEEKYDVCNPNNVLQHKETSRLTKVASNLFNKIEVEPEHLYFVFTSFYDVGLIKELIDINIPMTGIIEVNKVGGYDFPILDYKTEKSKLISTFWSQIYDYMHSEEECPKYLEYVYHMTISMAESAFDANTINDDNYCRPVFIDLCQEVAKLHSIRRHYINYIRHLKINRFDSKPKAIPAAHLKVYNNVINILPPECCTLFPVMYALIEDLSSRMPVALSAKKSSATTFTGFDLSDKQSSTIRSELLHTNVEMNRSVKCCAADILNTSITKKMSTFEKKIKYSPKVNIKLSTKPILVDENNDLELLLNPYKKLYPLLLTIHLDKFVKSRSVLLWQMYPVAYSNSCDCLKKRADIRSISETLDMSLDDVRTIVHTFLFNSITCESKSGEIEEIIFYLQTSFPKKDWFTPNVTKEKMSGRFKIDPIAIDSKESINLNVPEMEYTSIPSVHEARNMLVYKWHESLNELVMLQELCKAERDYLCMDHVYCKYDDTILLRFHNDLDKYGVNNKRRKDSLRTTLGVREFCKYIVHEQAKWLLSQEKQYQDECNRQYEEAQIQNRALKNQFYPELVFDDIEFLHKGSLKEKLLIGDQIEQAAGKNADKGKGNKDSDKGKGKGASSSVKATLIPLLEKLSQPITAPVPKKMTLREREENEPFKFHAYNVSMDRFQLAGATTVFCSRDGYKVTIDTTRFAKQSKNLSIDACVNGNSFILHYNKTTLAHPFGFRCVLSDNTNVAFSKPEKKIEPEEFICEKICKSLKKKQKKTQELYFVSEKKLSVTKCFKIPRITKRVLILSEELLTSFLNRLNVRRIPTQLLSTQSLSPEDLEKFKKALGSEDSYESGSTDSNVSEELVDVEASVMDDIEREQSFQYQTLFDRSKAFSSTRLREKDATKKKCLKKLKKTIDAQMPIFKICSSPLHKYHYVKRVKSHVEMQIGTLLKRITYKQPLYKSKINLQISKLLPVKSVDVNPPNYAYKMKTSLPSGLMVESVETGEKAAFNIIRQRYLDKGPQCQTIYNEYSRTFTRSGNIIIKKSDGDIEVINVHGEIVKCEIPPMNIINKPVVKKDEKPNLAPLNVTDLTKFQKHLHKSVNRMKRHVIDSPRSQHLMSRKASAKLKKQIVQDQDQIYLIQDSIAPFKRFSLMTTNGKLLKIIPSIITEEQRLYTSTSFDYLYDEMLSEREDGVQTKIDRESSLVTQFADGTRISTWLDIEPNLLYLVEPSEPQPDGFAHKEQQTEAYEIVDETEYEGEDESEYEECSENSIFTNDSSDKKSNREEKIDGWVSVFLNFKYEHPNYATVIFYGQSNNSEIILPNNVNLASSSNGEYEMTLEKVTAKITTEKILLEAKLCNECQQRSTLNFNIKPLYFYKRKDAIIPTDQLFRTIDTFGKSFKVTFDGTCVKDAYYEESELNLVDCPKHYAYEPQKLFVLERNLGGRKLWDVNSYKKRLTEGTRCGDTIVNNCEDPKSGQPRVELRTMASKSNYEKFLTLYEEPFLMLKKNKSKKNKKQEPAYVTQQIISQLPTVPHSLQVFSKFSEICSARFPTFFQSVRSEFESFLTQLTGNAIYIDKKQKKASEFPNHEIANSFASEQFILTMEMRYQMWLQQMEICKIEYNNRFIPKYFDSSYGYSKFEKDEIPTSIESNYGESDASFLCHCDVLNKLVSPKSISPSESIHVSEPKTILEVAKPPEPVDTQIISHIEVERIPSEEETPSLSQDVELDKYRLVIGEMLLNETKNMVLKTAMDMPCDHSAVASEEKVSSATKILYGSLMNSLKEYELNKPVQNFVTCSATVSLQSLSKLKLNAVEWILLWNNIESFAETFLDKKNLYENMIFTPKYVCETPKDCSGNLPFEDPLLATDNDKHVSGFEIYNLYSHLQRYERKESQKRNVSVTFSHGSEKDSSVLGCTISQMIKKGEKLTSEILSASIDESNSPALTYKPPCKKCANMWNLKQKSVIDLTHLVNLQSSTSMKDDSVEFLLESPIPSTANCIQSIDSHTDVLETEPSKDLTESMNVLFSRASLKCRQESEDFSMPYSQTLPNGGLQNLIMNNKLDEKFDRTEPNDEIDPVDFGGRKFSTIKMNKPGASVNAKILDSDAKNLEDPFSGVAKITPTGIPYRKPLRKSLGVQIDVTKTDENKIIGTSEIKL